MTGLTLEQLEEEYSEQLPVDVPAGETSENAASENAASENTATETASETTEAPTESVRARLKATRAELEALGAINPPGAGGVRGAVRTPRLPEPAD